MMEIYAIGTSHKYAPVELRERVAIGEDELVDALHDLTRELAAEAAIVSTCNRTEIYVVPQSEDFHADQLREWLARRKGVELPERAFFPLYACGAARHLFSVAAGLDSQILGDIQIIGQVKQAFQTARDAGTLGKLLTRMFSAALHTGKRVKSETELFTGAASVSYAAVELARKIFHPLSNQRTLVVGAGDTGELTAVSLRGQGVKDVTVTNRTEERARDLIGRLGFGTFMPLAHLPSRLHEFDIVIVSTGATEYLITHEMARAAHARRSGEMQLIVDISVPRNVDPAVAGIPGIFCKDINDLNGVIEANVARRRADLPKADAIITDELAAFAAWCNLLPVTPVVARLQQQSEQIVRAELDKVRHRFGESDFRNVEKLVASVVRKIIGIPMSHLLNGEADLHETLQKAEYVSLLFNLDALADGAGATPTAAHGADRAPSPGAAAVGATPASKEARADA